MTTVSFLDAASLMAFSIAAGSAVPTFPSGMSSIKPFFFIQNFKVGTGVYTSDCAKQPLIILAGAECEWRLRGVQEPLQ